MSGLSIPLRVDKPANSSAILSDIFCSIAVLPNLFFSFIYLMPAGPFKKIVLTENTPLMSLKGSIDSILLIYLVSNPKFSCREVLSFCLRYLPD
jgi:hypothetical protein